MSSGSLSERERAEVDKLCAGWAGRGISPADSARAAGIEQGWLAHREFSVQEVEEACRLLARLVEKDTSQAPSVHARIGTEAFLREHAAALHSSAVEQPREDEKCSNPYCENGRVRCEGGAAKGVYCVPCGVCAGGAR